MAEYKDALRVDNSSSIDFDRSHSPGIEAPFAGIYRCVGCDDEIGIAAGHRLPPQNHHQHTSSLKVEWRLLVRATQKQP